MIFGTRFVWVTDCYAIRFILSYEGNNPAVLRLQMRLMCWDMDIVHRNDIYLTNTGYWSRLGEDICYDPLFKAYLDFDCGLREKFPAPTNLPMLLESMPYYRGPRVVPPPSADEQSTDINHYQLLFTQVMTRMRATDYATYPLTQSPSENSTPSHHPMDMPHSWAVYSFGGGHFAPPSILCQTRL